MEITNILILIFVTMIFLNFNHSDTTANILEETKFQQGRTGNKESDNNDETFVPTHEWKTVNKGQPIPKGLHVRMNLATGKTEAKFVEEDKDPETAMTSVAEPDTDEAIQPPEQLLSPETIKKALKNIKSDDTKPTAGMGEDRKYRSYKELVEEFRGYDMAIKTDAELMSKLMERFRARKELGKTEQAAILTDLEYLVHQVDNAREFARTGWLLDVVLPGLNSTEPELRSASARLLGSAVQSNPPVQVSAVEGGSLGALLRTLALDVNPGSQAGALYALSCLVRGFPAAQKLMVDEGGLEVLATVFDKGGQLRVQTKVITLLHDLVSEQHDAEQSEEHGSERLQQYWAVDLEARLQTGGWCLRLSSLLRAAGADHDMVEKVVSAMLGLVGVCSGEFRVQQEVLERLRGQYSTLGEAEEYYRDIAQMLESILARTRGREANTEL